MLYIYFFKWKYVCIVYCFGRGNFLYTPFLSQRKKRKRKRISMKKKIWYYILYSILAIFLFSFFLILRFYFLLYIFLVLFFSPFFVLWQSLISSFFEWMKFERGKRTFEAKNSGSRQKLESVGWELSVLPFLIKEFRRMFAWCKFPHLRVLGRIKCHFFFLWEKLFNERVVLYDYSIE